MISERYLKKYPCKKCGEQCYSLCFIGKKLVCVDCFKKACDKADMKQSQSQ